MSAPDTIVLIHGFWVTPRSWEHWVAHYEAKGFTVLAPAYPGFEVEVEALNEDTTPIEEVTVPAIIEHLESVVGAARQAADPHRPFGRRRVHADPARPRVRRGRRRDQLGADRGRQARAAVAGQGDVPGAQEPGQPAQGRRLHARAVGLRVHQRLPGGAGPRHLRAVPHPRLRLDLLGQRAGQHPPGQGRQLGELQERGPRAAAVHLRQRGPPDAAGDPAVQRQALQLERAHRGQGVRRPAPAARQGRVGGGRRLRARLGAQARPAERRPAHPHRRPDRCSSRSAAGGC